MTTTGQRIAAKRKELGLSQEALGEKLGVSRQSIYKWESDTSLPEIEKLISLSRLFSVSVGWLLGVEENSENQEKLLEDVLARYQPPKPSPWSKWLTGGLAVLCAAALVSVLALHAQVTHIQKQYDILNASFGTVRRQLDSLLPALDRQPDYLSNCSVEISGFDLAQNSVTFTVWATFKPELEKDYPNANIFFGVASDRVSNATMLEAMAGPRQTYRMELTAQLGDYMVIQVMFRSDGGRMYTQDLKCYYDLYQKSLPVLSLQECGYSPSQHHNWVQWNSEPYQPTQVHIPENTFCIQPVDEASLEFGPSPAVKELRVGLFHNQTLVCWLDSPNLDNIYHLSEQDLTLQENDTLVIAALFTDEYGRQGVKPLTPAYVRILSLVQWNEGFWNSGLLDLGQYHFED